MKTLITGTAGFIGFSLTKALLEKGLTVFGLDNLSPLKNDDPIKTNRLKELGVFNAKENKETQSSIFENFSFIKLDISNQKDLKSVFDNHDFDTVIHLAAKTGVRAEPEENAEYVSSNILGFTNILENIRKNNIEKFIYASSSSVYGASKNKSFSTDTEFADPLNVYAATKRSDELLAITYNHLYKIPAIGLRFFTVYGPWARTDMAMYQFTEALYKGKEIELFNKGEMFRDFTFIDDIVEAIQILLDSPSERKHIIYNVGSERPIKLSQLIDLLENATHKKANLKLTPKPNSDMLFTCADNGELKTKLGFTVKTSFEEGVQKFVEWYKEYNGSNPNQL